MESNVWNYGQGKKGRKEEKKESGSGQGIKLSPVNVIDGEVPREQGKAGKEGVRKVKAQHPLDGTSNRAKAINIIKQRKKRSKSRCQKYLTARR